MENQTFNLWACGHVSVPSSVAVIKYSEKQLKKLRVYFSSHFKIQTTKIGKSGGRVFIDLVNMHLHSRSQECLPWGC